MTIRDPEEGEVKPLYAAFRGWIREPLRTGLATWVTTVRAATLVSNASTAAARSTATRGRRHSANSEVTLRNGQMFKRVEGVAGFGV